MTYVILYLSDRIAKKWAIQPSKDLFSFYEKIEKSFIKEEQIKKAMR